MHLVFLLIFQSIVFCILKIFYSEQVFEKGEGAAGVTLPLLENNFVLFFPLVLEIRGELIPDGEEGAGRNLLFSGLWLH